MIGTFVIVFREVLEAALVVGVVAGALKGLPHRGRWVGLGVLLGAAGAAAVAAGIGAISSFAHGTGQEIFAAAVLFTAGFMLAWHNVWMARHGRAVASRLTNMGAGVLAGQESRVALTVVTGLAVMREGSETALFLYGMLAGGAGSHGLLTGGLLGLAAGAGVGFVLFAGLSRVPARSLFRVSGWVILFIAAGMVARGAQFLVQANILPPLVDRVWDSSRLVSGNGLLGRSLSALVGYTPAPSLMQLLFWFATLAAVGGLMLAQRRSGESHRRTRAAAALTLTVCGMVIVLLTGHAHAADYKVYSPAVVRGENEVELRSYRSWGSGERSGDEKGVKASVGRAFTDWWSTEFYVNAEQESGESLKVEEFEWENRFQLTPQGKYWVSVGLVNENEIPRHGDDPYEVKLGPIFERDFGRLSARLNVLAARELGNNSGSGIEVEYRAAVEYRWRRALSPMFEAYGLPAGRLGGEHVDKRHQVGPGMTGRVLLGPGRSLHYAVAALFGTTRAAADTTAVLRLEYEFF